MRSGAAVRSRFTGDGGSTFLDELSSAERTAIVAMAAVVGLEAGVAEEGEFVIADASFQNMEMEDLVPQTADRIRRCQGNNGCEFRISAFALDEKSSPFVARQAWRPSTEA